MVTLLLYLRVDSFKGSTFDRFEHNCLHNFNSLQNNIFQQVFLFNNNTCF